MTISRILPPLVAQTLDDSCWAAVLASWSRVDPRIPALHQADLVRRWGEGATGGITPAAKISYMDPDGGHDRWKAIAWFLARGPYEVMRKR